MKLLRITWSRWSSLKLCIKPCGGTCRKVVLNGVAWGLIEQHGAAWSYAYSRVELYEAAVWGLFAP